jgi:hypothetical protein
LPTFLIGPMNWRERRKAAVFAAGRLRHEPTFGLLLNYHVGARIFRYFLSLEWSVGKRLVNEARLEVGRARFKKLAGRIETDSLGRDDEAQEPGCRFETGHTLRRSALYVAAKIVVK